MFQTSDHIFCHSVSNLLPILSPTRVGIRGATSKMCLRKFVPTPHPGTVEVVEIPIIGSTRKGELSLFCFFSLKGRITQKSGDAIPCKYGLTMHEDRKPH